MKALVIGENEEGHMSIRKIMGQAYWRIRYTYKYITVNHKFNKVGLKSDIRKPLRVCGGDKIVVGDKCFIMNGLRIEAVTKWGDTFYSPKIIIEDNVQIQQDCHVTCANSIKIGEGSCILPQVLITDIEHKHIFGKSPSQTELIVGEITIGKNVSVGMGARIIGKTSISIGDNAVIGANSVVTKDVPEGAVVAGIPARVIRWTQE